MIVKNGDIVYCFKENQRGLWEIVKKSISKDYYGAVLKEKHKGCIYMHSTMRMNLKYCVDLKRYNSKLGQLLWKE